MALKLLPVLQVIVILGLPQAFAYPVYGTKRYGRGSSSNRPVSAGWPMPINYQALTRNQRYPVNYYEMYPYGQNYPDDYYYPQESLSYPLYYPARTSKYEVYQAVLPYYYTETPVPRLRYGIYGYGGSKEPLVDLEEEVLEEEREDRDEPQPIGHEMYYENDQESSRDDSLDDVNAAFLQNLIMSEMYKNAMNKQNLNYYKGYSPEVDLSTEDSYGKWEEYPTEPHPKYYQEDEDVKELKQLSKSRYEKEKEILKPTNEDRITLFQQGKANPQNKKMNKNNYYWNNSDNKRGYFQWPYSEAQKQPSSTTSATTQTPITTTTTPAVKVDTRGQKEEVLMRPATPVRHPFSDLNMLIEGERKRTPSVYETIKHMLDMEKNLDKVSKQIT